MKIPYHSFSFRCTLDPGMVAWLMGIVMAMTTPADYAPVIGIVTACVVYLAGYRVRLSRPGCEVQ